RLPAEALDQPGRPMADTVYGKEGEIGLSDQSRQEGRAFLHSAIMSDECTTEPAHQRPHLVELLGPPTDIEQALAGEAGRSFGCFLGKPCDIGERYLQRGQLLAQRRSLSLEGFNPLVALG